MTVGNRLLDGLPAEAWRVLQPYLRDEPLRVGQTLVEPGRRVEQAYFPIHGVVSLLTVTGDGTGIQNAMVGWDGMLPVCVALGGDVSGQKAVVQVAGTALAIGTVRLQQQMNATPVLERALLSYVQTQFNAMTQTAVCNGLHLLERRCARWLLMAHDRVSGNEIRITHGALARLLGARRPGITVAAHALQEQGLIAYRHGTVLVRNRRGLEATACECYRAMVGFAVTDARPGQSPLAPARHRPRAQEQG